MTVLSELPSPEHVEWLLHRVKKVRTKWHQHIIFIDTELSSRLSTSANDYQVPLGDVLAGLAHEAKVFEQRAQRLVDVDIIKEAERMRTLESLLSLLNHPVATETPVSMLRRAAVRLEEEIRECSVELAKLEDRVSSYMQDLLDWLTMLQRQEQRHPTTGLMDSLKIWQDRQEELAAAPEDCVWTLQLQYMLQFYQRYGQSSETREALRERESHWVKVLYWAAKYGVQLGLRQTLITEYFRKVSDTLDDEVGSDDGSESENSVRRGERQTLIAEYFGVVSGNVDDEVESDDGDGDEAP